MNVLNALEFSCDCGIKKIYEDMAEHYDECVAEDLKPKCPLGCNKLNRFSDPEDLYEHLEKECP